jgi:hypothetical protein
MFLVTSRIRESCRIMLGFAERTGLTTSRSRLRHLATDACAVENFLALSYLRRGQEDFLRLALRLVDQTHEVLGRRRPEEGAGWLSGLSDPEAHRHPTAGGLRLGNPLAERHPDEPFDLADELSSDGQAFHDLARWMRALDNVARCTGDLVFNRWARELARTACRAFRPSSRPELPLLRKMSTDLSYPLLSRTSRFGPLDGLVTCLELEATAAALGARGDPPDLQAELAELAELSAGLRLRTHDPQAGAGMLSCAAALLRLLTASGAQDRRFPQLLLTAASDSLLRVAAQLPSHGPRESRSPLEELSLSRAIRQAIVLRPIDDVVGRLAERVDLAHDIETFWSHAQQRRSEVWRRQLELHEVSLAASLIGDLRAARADETASRVDRAQL